MPNTSSLEETRRRRMLPTRLFGSFRPAWRLARIPSRFPYLARAQQQLGTFRANSSAASFDKAKDKPVESPGIPDQIQLEPSEPRLAIAFTCTADGCNHRSAHTFTKRAYERGIVIIQCPSCKNRCGRIHSSHSHTLIHSVYI